MSLSNDQQQFIARIGDHLGIVHKVCSVYAWTQADRDDLYQEIVLQLWRSYRSFEGRSKFSTWMYRVALNTAMTRVRRRELLEFRPDEELNRFPAPAPDDERREQFEQLERAIRTLKPPERALVLMWLDDLSYREIGETLGLTEKNVSVKLTRIRKRLAAILGGGER